MTDKLNIGILLPTRGLLMQGDQPDDIEQLISMAVTSEEAGVDSVWVGDSLTAKPRLEPLTTLSAIASRTSLENMNPFAFDFCHALKDHRK